MPLPSIRVMGIATADPSLFESLMARAGFKIAKRDNDPLNNNVQEEAVNAIASAITEDSYYGVRLSPYHRKLKIMAEQAGYVVMIENCGPPGADPCTDEEEFGGGMTGDDLVPLGEVGEGEAIIASHDDMPPVDDDMGVPSEVEQIASLPIGTDLAAEILAVVKGEGTAALDSDEGLHGEMPMGGEDFGPESEEMPPVSDEGEERPL